MIVDRMRAFNMRELRRHPARTAMSLAVVAISATLLVAVFGIAGSITGSSDRLVAGIGGNASLEVSGVTDTGFPEAMRHEVAKVPELPRPCRCCVRLPADRPSASWCSAWTTTSKPCSATCSVRSKTRSARWSRSPAELRSALGGPCGGRLDPVG